MKIRNGFVSNSSSSSFTCNVCGTSESGMDMSAKDFDMETCINGHTFCNSHISDNIETISPKQYRESIKRWNEKCNWIGKETIQSNIVEMEMVPDDEIEDFYNERYSDDGVIEYKCPICSFKSLDKNDGFKYLKKKFSMDDNEILEIVKVQFKTYKEFTDFLNNVK